MRQWITRNKHQNRLNDRLINRPLEVLVSVWTIFELRSKCSITIVFATAYIRANMNRNDVSSSIFLYVGLACGHLNLICSGKFKVENGTIGISCISLISNFYLKWTNYLFRLNSFILCIFIKFWFGVLWNFRSVICRPIFWNSLNSIFDCTIVLEVTHDGIPHTAVNLSKQFKSPFAFNKHKSSWCAESQLTWSIS